MCCSHDPFSRNNRDPTTNCKIVHTKGIHVISLSSAVKNERSTIIGISLRRY
eukprot:UN21629